VLIAPAATVVLAAAGEPLTRNGARDEARRELSRHVYDQARPSLLMRAISAAIGWVRDVIDKAAAATPGGGFGLLALAVLLAAAVVLFLRLGPVRRAHTAVGLLDAPAALSAAGLRAEAEAAARDGRWADAVRARLRAVVRLLEERTLLEPRPGRTATEVAEDAAAVLPDLREPLRSAARTFGEVWYGHRPATEVDYRTIVELDELLQRHRQPSTAWNPAAPGAPQVPA
jgi:hypothetical protein